MTNGVRTPEQLGFVDISYANASGVLAHEGRVVYVGQTINGLRRIGQHTKDKVFDQVFFLRTPEQELGELEEWVIELFNPKYNKRKPTDNKVAKIAKASRIRQRAREEVQKLVRGLKVNIGGMTTIFNHDSYQIERPRMIRRI